VVVMTALFAGGWAGMGPINDIDRGVTDRFLVSPVRCGALVAGQLTYQALVSVVQSVIIVALGLAAGARLAVGAGYIDERLIPSWMRAVADYNPVNWAVQAGRQALEASPDWGFVLAHGAYLLALALACGAVATYAFRSYQRSV
jgi:ABC-2 type transport system permease protein